MYPGTMTCLPLTLDIDLTPASGFTSNSKRQFASVGAEFNAWKWAQLRAG
ncbi:putative exported protein [Escherichia coli Jurua 20/10]|nr:putative exported protein [Escherichia coli Jurua 20/10]